MNTYDYGDAVRFSATFKNTTPIEVDPTAVLFKMKTAAGAVTTYTYGGTASNTALVRDDVGDYHVDFTLSAPGLWSYRWESSGSLITADEVRVMVRESYFI